MIYHTLRGGAYYNATWPLRSTYRYGNLPVFRLWNFGFRLVVRREP